MMSKKCQKCNKNRYPGCMTCELHLSGIKCQVFNCNQPLQNEDHFLCKHHRFKYSPTPMGLSQWLAEYHEQKSD